MEKEMRILLAGQPNCGKTTLFNALTGGREKTGNRAGVTVKEARRPLRSMRGLLIDLPGLCAMTGGGLEEENARQGLRRERPDLILNILDSTSLERGLTLTLALSALGIPMVLALNMADEAKKLGLKIDCGALEKRLGAPAVLISARTGEGLPALLQLMKTGGRRPRAYSLNTAAERYKKAEELSRACRREGGRERSYKGDRAALSPLLAFPLFFLVMGLVFLITFQWAGPFLSKGITVLVALLQKGILKAAAAWPMGLREFLAEGVVGGVGYVLSFLPQITLLFFQLSVLEDLGYLPRVAFLLDGLMKKAGMDGRCIVPLLLGFGCTVPAALSCRTLEREGDRSKVLRLLPFVPCSAKLPVTALLGSVLFPAAPGLGALLFYGISLLTGLLYACFMRKEGRAEEGSFVLELPPFRLPSLKSVLRQTEGRVEAFLLRAGTVLLVSAAALWGLMHLDTGFAYTNAASESLLAALGGLLAPLLRSLGFGEWGYAVALLSGFGAKETMAAALLLLQESGAVAFTANKALCFGVFSLLLPPCMGALGAIRGEMGRKAFALAAALQLLTAYGATAVIRLLQLLFL